MPPYCDRRAKVRVVSLAGELLALAAEVEQTVQLVRGITDQASLRGLTAGAEYVTIPTTTRDIHLPKERP